MLEDVTEETLKHLPSDSLEYFQVYRFYQADTISDITTHYDNFEAYNERQYNNFKKMSSLPSFKEICKKLALFLEAPPDYREHLSIEQHFIINNTRIISHMPQIVWTHDLSLEEVTPITEPSFTGYRC